MPTRNEGCLCKLVYQDRDGAWYMHVFNGIPSPFCSLLQTKGTSSFGKRGHNKSHTLCIRCGSRSYHVQKSTCSSCGFPAARKRTYQWGQKAIRRKTTGTGRMRSLKLVRRRFRNGFREGMWFVKKSAVTGYLLPFMDDICVANGAGA